MRLWKLLALLPFAAGARLRAWRAPAFDVAKNASVVYGAASWNCTNVTDASTCDSSGLGRGALTLALYAPAARNASAPAPPPRKPAVVLIHGGSYVNGDAGSDNMAWSASWFAARGWVAASINYRVRGDRGLCPFDLEYAPEYATYADNVTGAVHPVAWVPSWAEMYPAIRDAKAAVRWLRAHADALGVEPRAVAAYGSSAGGASAIALGANVEADFKDELGAAADPTLAATFPEESSAVAAVVSHWGALYADAALEQRDGVARASARSAPTAGFHGGSDTVVSPENERALCEGLEAVGVACHTSCRG